MNRERRKGKKVNEGIEWDKWKEHFMRLLGGVEDKVVRGKGSDRRGMDKEEEINGEKIKGLAKLKDGKATGIDGIPNEVWKYGGEAIGKWVKNFCNRIWRGEGWLEG